MMFLFPRWDMLVPWRVDSVYLSKQRSFFCCTSVTLNAHGIQNLPICFDQECKATKVFDLPATPQHCSWDPSIKGAEGLNLSNWQWRSPIPSIPWFSDIDAFSLNNMLPSGKPILLVDTSKIVFLLIAMYSSLPENINRKLSNSIYPLKFSPQKDVATLGPRSSAGRTNLMQPSDWTLQNSVNSNGVLTHQTWVMLKDDPQAYLGAGFKYFVC